MEIMTKTVMKGKPFGGMCEQIYGSGLEKRIEVSDFCRLETWIYKDNMRKTTTG